MEKLDKYNATLLNVLVVPLEADAFVNADKYIDKYYRAMDVC